MNEWSSDTTAPNENDEERNTRNSPAASGITHSAHPPESVASLSTYDEQEHRIASPSRQRLEPHQRTTAPNSHYDMPIQAPVHLHSIFNTGGPAYVPYDYSRKAGPSNVNPLPWVPNDLHHPPGHPPGHPSGHSLGHLLAPPVGASVAASPGVLQQAATPASAIINSVPTIPHPNVLPNTSLPSNIVPFHPAHSQNSPLHHVGQPQVNEYRPYFDIPGEVPWYNQRHLGIRAGIDLGANVQAQNLPIPSSIIPPQNHFGQASLDQLQFTSGAAYGPAPKPKQKPRPRSKSSSLSPQASTGGPLKNTTRRSRLGCLTCRQRKKRCCESKPKCTECSRLRLNCVWPRPGTEHKNKPREIKEEENTEQHEIYGKIKVLRGIVEYKSN